MGAYFVELAGTAQGQSLALILALVSALAHAIFAAINKGGADPYLSRASCNVFYSLMAAPFALFVFPLPEGQLIVILAISFVVHLGYEWMQSAAFSRGAFTLVYPIARGTAPLITALAAIFIFSESLEPVQWFGILLLSGSIISLAWANLNDQNISADVKSRIRPSVFLSLGAGIAIAFYTTIDAYGIRLALDPFMFLAWFFFLGGFGFPLVALHRYMHMEEKPPLTPLVYRGIIGGSIALFSFAALMLATRIGKVSEAAALRETSIIFAAIIGMVIFKEKLSARKLVVIGLIAMGAILIEFG